MKRLLGVAALVVAGACTGDVFDETRGQIEGTEQALTGSCENACGGRSQDGCYCDELCVRFGDCCDDKVAVCDAPPPEPDAGSDEDSGAGEDAGVDPVEPDPVDDEVPATAHCEPVSNWDPAWSSFEEEVLERVNDARANGASCGGVPYQPTGPLTMQPALRCASRLHSVDMGVNDFMSHTGSDGSSPWQRMDAAGYSGNAKGENVAAGYSTPQAVVQGWLKSSGHCKNIMNPDFKAIGVGYAYEGDSKYKHQWTQGFGSNL